MLRADERTLTHRPRRPQLRESANLKILFLDSNFTGDLWREIDTGEAQSLTISRDEAIFRFFSFTTRLSSSVPGKDHVQEKLTQTQTGEIRFFLGQNGEMCRNIHSKWWVVRERG